MSRSRPLDRHRIGLNVARLTGPAAGFGLLVSVLGCMGSIDAQPGVHPSRTGSAGAPGGGTPGGESPGAKPDAGVVPAPPPRTEPDATPAPRADALATTPVSPVDARADAERDPGSPPGLDAGTRADATVSNPSAACAPGLPSDLADLAPLVIGNTLSTLTPMGKNYEVAAKHVATADERAFLTDPKRQPVIPPSTMGLHRQAFPVTLYPSGKPLPADANQHAIGDCNGLAAFVAMAYQNPAFVQSLIVDKGDDTYEVAMFDPLARPMKVMVDNVFLADAGNKIASVSGKNGVVTWTGILEKAVMKYIEVYKIRSEIGGIGSEHTTPMFTGAGGSFAFVRGRLGPADLTRTVKAALGAGKLISGGFGKISPLGNVTTVTAHAYTVMIPVNGQTMISMRNPWGVNPLVAGGGFEVMTDGVIHVPPTKVWSDDIDIRIIDAGAACKIGAPVAYVPTVEQMRTNDVRIVEFPRAALPVVPSWSAKPARQ